MLHGTRADARALRTGAHEHPLACRDKHVRGMPRALQWALKLMMSFWALSVALLAALYKHGRPLFVLVQTPPALPVLPVLALLRLCCGLKIIVDFHNLAFTLMRPCKHLDFRRDPDWTSKLRSRAVRCSRCARRTMPPAVLMSAAPCLRPPRGRQPLRGTRGAFDAAKTKCAQARTDHDLCLEVERAEQLVMQVRLAVALECETAKRCDGALAVTARFADWLQRMWGIRAEVLYDKAPSFFRPAGPQEVRSTRTIHLHSHNDTAHG